MTTQQMRVNVAARITAADDTIIPDLLNPAMTQDHLICLLDRMTAPPDKGGLGYKVEITSLRRDHGDDSALGPHCHAKGWAADTWCDDLASYLHDLVYNNQWVTKVGLGGSQAQALMAEGVYHGTIVFYDNSQPHIHVQSA